MQMLDRIDERQSKTDLTLGQISSRLNTLEHGQAALQKGQAALEEGQAVLQKGQTSLQEDVSYIKSNLEYAWQDTNLALKRIKEHEKEFHNVG